MKTVRFLFNDEMARAIVEGRKTVTRRPVTPQPAVWPELGGGLWRGGRRFPNDTGPDPLAPCAPGNLLIGRECFQAWTGGEMSGYEEAEGRIDLDYASYSFTYRADGDCFPKRWRPSIHMPDAAARIRRRVVSVTVELIQDITEADAVREGVAPLFTQHEVDTVVGLDRYKSEPMPWTNYLWHGRKDATRANVAAWPHQLSSYGSARDSFSSLWHSAYAANGLGWDVNPWVWRIEFSAENVQDAAP